MIQGQRPTRHEATTSGDTHVEVCLGVAVEFDGENRDRSSAGPIQRARPHGSFLRHRDGAQVPVMDAQNTIEDCAVDAAWFLLSTSKLERGLTIRAAKKFFREPPPRPEHRVNERIRLSPVRVVDSSGDQIGVLPVDEAIDHAKAAGMDLVEVAPRARPPVCKIMDSGTSCYQMDKKERRSKQQQSRIDVKQVKLRPAIDDHDFRNQNRACPPVFAPGQARQAHDHVSQAQAAAPRKMDMSCSNQHPRPSPTWPASRNRRRRSLRVVISQWSSNRRQDLPLFLVNGHTVGIGRKK